jgi:hypothetical protein
MGQSYLIITVVFMCVFLGEHCGTIAKHEKYTSHRVLMWMLITVIYFEESVNEPFKVNKLIRHLKRKSGCVDDHNADQCSQTFFSTEEPPVRILLYPEETLPMKRSTAGNLFVAFSETNL